MPKINDVIFLDADFQGPKNPNKVGHIRKIETDRIYPFNIVAEEINSEMITYLEETDLDKYEEYISNPKVSKNNKTVWFNILKTTIESLNR